MRNIKLPAWRFSTVTPACFTSAGRIALAYDTRFCTITAALSALVPFLKYTVILAAPLLEAEDTI